MFEKTKNAIILDSVYLVTMRLTPDANRVNESILASKHSIFALLFILHF